MKKFVINLFMLAGLMIAFAVSFIVIVAVIMAVLGLAIILPMGEKLSHIEQKKLGQRYRLPF